MPGRLLARDRDRAIRWAVACLMSLLGAHASRAQELASHAPIVVAADQVRTWRDGDAHFVHLVGRAAVLQEVEGVRAEEMLVRITPPPRGKQGAYIVEIRGERAVPATRPRDPARQALTQTMRSTAGVEIRPPYAGGAALQLEGAPEGLAIVDRFQGDFPAAPAAPPPAPERAVDASVVGLARNPMIPLTSPADREPEATPLTGTPSPAPLDRSVVEASLDPQLPSTSRPLPAPPPTGGPTPIEPGPAEGPIAPPLPEPEAPPPIPGLPDPPTDPEPGPLPGPAPGPEAQPVPPELIPELPEAAPPAPAPGAEDPGSGLPDVPPELIPEAVPPAIARRPAESTSAGPAEEAIPPWPVDPEAQEPVDLPPPAVPGTAFPPVPEIDPSTGPAVPPAPTRFQSLEAFEQLPLPDDPAPVQPGNVVGDPLDIPSDGPPPRFLDEMGGDPIPGIDPLPEDMGEGPILEMPEEPTPNGPTPIAPGYQRNINIVPRDGPLNYRIWTLPQTSDGTLTTLIDGGVHMVVDDPKFGTVDIVADKAVIWTRPGKRGGRAVGGGTGVQSPDQPLEVYLEGNVRVLQDKREAAGLEDQTEYNADRFYADLPMERYLALDAELKHYSQGFIAPLRTMADSIFHYREYQTAPDGSVVLGEDGKPLKSLAHIQAENATVTGSQFANPGYRFDTRSIEMTELPPNSQRTGLLRRLFNPTTDNTNDRLFMVDARQNTYYLGGVPYFFWPRFYTTSEDINPPLQQIGFRTNNLFGQMVLTDWDGFKVLGLKRPKGIESWNIDADYLSDRGFGLGSELGYSGLDFSQDLFGVDLFPGIDASYFGYSEAWGLRDHGIDNLGAGPAIVTNYPPGAQIRLYDRRSVPPFQDWRGRSLWRHMQSLLPNDADPLEDFRFQVEIALESDRHFLEQYFNRVFNSGLDQANRVYGIRQWENRALSLWVEGNQQSWYTDSQWLPKLDYYRLGGAPFELDRYIQYFHHSGVDYANVHTASEVNNTEVFNFLPYDPTSLTSGVFRSGRMYTNHELQVPINLQFIRLTPYVQGQLVGWDSQYDTPLPAIGNVPGLTDQDYIRGAPGSMVGRAWGAYGGRADLMVSRIFTGVDNELLNVHGLHHKVNFYVDYRNAVSDQPIRRFGIQDDLDDNTYELVRRYTAMLYYNNGVLPAQYNPVLLNLRRTISPITGTVDVQDSIETARVGVSQRLQTKRGPIDNRHIIDWMTFDIGTTYFPQSGRDNFGRSWGQATYNYEWFIGDRTSIVSSGWFDFFGINGDQNPAYPRNRDGIQAIMTGVNLTRIPRTSLTLGYSILNTGPINSSALNVNGGYWLSPKWYATAGGVYDFGEGLLLSTFFSVARIGPDFITSVGLNVNPLQDNFGFSFEIVPRFSPNTRIGSGAGAAFRPDIRYLPQQ